MDFQIAAPPLIRKLRKLLVANLITYQELSDQVLWFTETLESFLYILKDVEDRVSPSLAGLLNDAEDIIDAVILRTEVQRSRLDHKNYTHELESTISELLNELRKLPLPDRRLYDQIVPTGHTGGWKIIRGDLDNTSHIVGLEKEIRNLVRRLLDYDDQSRNLCVIPVVGVAGSGKTTLLRNIYNRVDIKQHFGCRAWVDVSTVLEGRNLLADIFNQVTVMTKEQRLSNDELKLRIRTFLEKKRYLIVLDGDLSKEIVLDGVRTTDVWDRLRRVLPDTENGSKIILLSHQHPHNSLDNSVHADDAQQANPETSPFQLRPLTEEESWALFLNKVTVSEDELTPDFVHLREQILRRCNGFPLAIVLLGGLLSTIDLIEWSRVIENAIFGKYPSTFSGVLAVSFQGLPYELKSCLLFMCLFPREYEIPVRRLFGLWISENMVTLSGTEERVVEDLAQIYFSELVGRNMIEVAKWRSDGRPKACRMPGVIYDFFLPKALDMGFLHVYGNSIHSNVKRYAHYTDLEKYPSDRHTIRSLRSYVSSEPRKQGTPAVGIGMLLIQLTGKRSFGLLMVLDLEGVYKPVLGKALRKLLLLRYLGLRSTVLDSLPESVGELQCLETLDVKHTNITNLPSSILKGKKLRHLYLNGINLDLSIEQLSSGSVGDLQTLSGISIGREGSVRNGLNRFTGLRKLGLTCHSTAMEEVVNWIPQLSNLRTLKLRSVDIFGQPSELKWRSMTGHNNLSHLYLLGVLPSPANYLRELPQNLEILTLSLSKLVDDPMPMLGVLPQLKTLRLLAQSYIGSRMNCCHRSFPQLRILKLWKLEELEEWRMEDGAMPCLRELEIRHCKNLKKQDGLENVFTLKELILTNMSEDFEADLKGSMRTDVFININKWELSPSASWRQELYN